MDTQIATHPSGRIHAVSCVQSDQDARRFRAVMECQGFKVERLSFAAAAVRFAQPTRPAAVPERPAQRPLPELGTRIRFRVGDQHLAGTVAAVLRWPADHPHCPDRTALLARAPGWEGLVDLNAFERVTEAQPVALVAPLLPQATSLLHPPPPQPDAWVQQGLW